MIVGVLMKIQQVKRIAYGNIASLKHTNFVVSNCGFFISHEVPFFGASPDAIISCSCCSLDGASDSHGVEIKYPYCCIEKFFTEKATDSNIFCLERVDGKLSLKHNHAYYYQMQLQMKCCNVKYGDFVVWMVPL